MTITEVARRGGIRAAANATPEQRTERARHAALARHRYARERREAAAAAGGA
jgi:hypothetical protein